jgi:hypothetical protein
LSEKAKKIYEYYQTYRTDSLEWREKRDRAKKVYLGNQWEDSVSKRLRARGQVDVVVNIIRVLLRNRVSSMVAQKPTGIIYGAGEKETELAPVLQDLIDYVWYISSGQVRTERVCMYQQREGIGYFVVAPDLKADFGKGELKIYDETYRHIYIPKSAGREWDFSDAARMIHTKLWHKDDFLANNPKHRTLGQDYFHPNDEIYWKGVKEHRESDEIDFPETMSESEFIREFDTYTRFFDEVPVIYHKPTGMVEVKDVNYTPNNNENELIKQGIIDFARAAVPRVRWQKSYGEKVFEHEEILPISNYPIVPVPDEDTGNAMPLGEIDFNFGIQELANKMFSILVHSAAMSSNYKGIIDTAKAGIQDFQKWKDDWVAPGSWQNMKQSTDGTFPIKEFRPEPLNPAYFPLFERMFQMIQYGLATFQAKLGDTSQAPDTFSATLQYGEWQNENLRIPLNRLEMALQRVFDIVLEWSPKFYTSYKVFEIINEEQPETQFINKPAYNIANSAFETLNDIRELRARYRIKMGSTMPAQSVAQLMIFKELAAANPMFMKYVIDYLPIKDKAKVKKDMDALAQTQQALQKSEGDSKKAQMFIEELLKEMARKDMEVEVDKTKNKLDAIEQETQIKMDGLEEKKKLEIEKAKLSVKEKKNAKKSDSNS